MKGQISLDLLLAVVVFAILFSVFFAFGDNIVQDIDELKIDAYLTQEANELRPNFAALNLPEEYTLIYNNACDGYSFLSDGEDYYVKDENYKKFISKGNLNDYLCNTEMYFTK